YGCRSDEGKRCTAKAPSPMARRITPYRNRNVHFFVFEALFQSMIRVFGHHISLRAVLFAIFELAVFVTFYNVSRVAVTYIPGSGAEAVYGAPYFLPLFCIIALCTAAACGLYNKEMCSDPHGIAMRLFTTSVLMYFLMATTISVTELAVEHTP